MDYIDLHTHSNCSDGTLTPTELVNRAINKGLRAIALTDHDTVNGVDEALAAAKASNGKIQVIPGTELSVAYKNRDIHMVGLCIDHHNPVFKESAEKMVAEREWRNEKMCANLRQAGIPITMEALRKGDPDMVVTRAHFGRFLLENKFVPSIKAAFEKYLEVDTPYYVPRKYIEPEEGIELIHKAGGIAIMAHPLHYKLEQKELEALVERLTKGGVDGIEVMYSNHMGQDETYARSLSNRFHLLPSGGSDFHGANKPAIEVGVGRGNLKIPYTYLENIAARANYPLDPQ